jgi:hypothetical protein
MKHSLSPHRITGIASVVIWLCSAQLALCFYNPSTGRWLSRDPMQESDDPNLYALLHNGPLDRIDGFGLKGCGCHVQSVQAFQVLSANWDLTWPIPGPPPSYRIHLDVRFILTLTPESEPTDCRITQWMLGHITKGSKIQRYDNWTLDAIGDGWWYNGSRWETRDAEWAGNTATFRDAPGDDVLSFPLRWCGTADSGDFFNFQTWVYDASRDDGLGPLPVAYLPWGLWISAENGGSLAKRFYIGQSEIWHY